MSLLRSGEGIREADKFLGGEALSADGGRDARRFDSGGKLLLARKFHFSPQLSEKFRFYIFSVYITRKTETVSFAFYGIVFTDGWVRSDVGDGEIYLISDGRACCINAGGRNEDSFGYRLVKSRRAEPSAESFAVNHGEGEGIIAPEHFGALFDISAFDKSPDRA